MSVLIKGMEMPKECRACPMIAYMSCGDTRCGAVGKLLAEDYMAITFEGRADCCPLVEVPVPHGRLIDGDALQCKVDDIGLGYYEVLGVTEDTIDSAPTIIEAEGGENHDD